MRAHVFRLTRGQDLRAGIETYAREHGIAAGCALSGVGCVLRARVRDASGVTVRQIDEPMEIVSLTGACGLRVVWIFTVFALDHSLWTLYLSYPVSWGLTALAHFICFLVVMKRQGGSADVPPPQPAAAK